jgi:hypothetical protein
VSEVAASRPRAGVAHAQVFDTVPARPQLEG